MRRYLPLMLIAFTAGLFLAGQLIRSQLGIEISQESIRKLVDGLGWKAGAIFVGLVTFRQFLFLPSMVVLPVGGIVFGAELGTVLGATGILGSALLKYSIARALGREWFRPYFGAAVDAFQQRAAAAGPMIVGLATAHPAGPMSPVFWGAGFAALPVVSFVLVVAIAAPVRAFAYSFFGSTLLEPGTPRFWVATVVLAAAALAPLAHPGVRERLMRAAGRVSADTDA
jgi:uncharacterized membrane protein YdjX (TVP38/TMEM64 family)